MSENELYETETMAELFARQGRLGEAIAIYRRLAGLPAAPDVQARWKARLSKLEARWQPGRVTESPPMEIPLPVAPGVSVLASEDQVTVAWALPPDAGQACLEIVLIQRTAAGIETLKRSVAVDTPAGRVGLAVPGLHSAIAAVGRTTGGHFVPLARSARK